ncbi:MAG: glycosyltransferase [Pseudomonadales bacterium]|jgi:GT2 family glycosyltransferase|nr:glycosyltransferase [Pseudomonadales bacterium]
MFSILIPTWNNLPYLKLCIDSIHRHSAHTHEIIVHVNEGTDGTLDWVREQGIAHTRSKGNVGVCIALNDVARLATRDWIVFMNDDMFCTPGWDLALEAAIERTGGRDCYLAGRMIEPIKTPNTLVHFANYGTKPENFDEGGLLAHVAALDPKRGDIDGMALQPMLLSRQLWHKVGGYSIEFGPGMSSDDDMLMKLWLVGCRIFRIVESCRIYHFACATTRRVRRNKGSREFLLKWGITQREFKTRYIEAVGKPQANTLSNVPRPLSLTGKIKRALYALRRYPLEDLEAWEPELPRQLEP